MHRQEGLGVVSIIGPGLIGGSIGLGLKQHRLADRVIGVGHRDSSLKKALEMHAIDYATKNIKEGVEGADIVILCTSVRLIPKMAEKAMPWMKDSSILTDVGSTKGNIMERILALKRGNVEFVGGHPLAGSEQRGVEAARADLFKGATCILTSVGDNGRTSLSVKSRHARKILKGMWEALGAKVKFLSPKEHDLIIAFISHLPQLAATTLVNTLRPRQLAFTARGFKDTTRIASSDPALWTDILLENRGAILEAITDFQGEIALIKKALLAKDSRHLLSLLKRAKRRRDSLVASKSHAVQN